MVYSMAFKAEWLKDRILCEWVSQVDGNPSLVFCKFCGISIRAQRSDLVRHAISMKHKKNYEKRHAQLQAKNSKYPSGKTSDMTKKTAKHKKKKPTYTHKPSYEGNTEPPVQVQGVPFQPQEPSISQSRDRPTEFSVDAAPRIRSEHSALPPLDEPSRAGGFPVGTQNIPSNGPNLSNGAYCNYYRDDSDDLNYLFGLCVGAGLRKFSEEQASLARLKIQTVMHMASLNCLQL